jgi:hypothetical protein
VELAFVSVDAAGSSEGCSSVGAGVRNGFIELRRLDALGCAGTARNSARLNFGFMENMVILGAFHRRSGANANDIDGDVGPAL